MSAQTWNEFFTELWNTEVWSWSSLWHGFILAIAAFVVFKIL